MSESKLKKCGGVVLKSIERLPSEILFDIFQKLPVKSLARARCTCKRWHTIMTDPGFLVNPWEDSIKHYTGYLYTFAGDPDLYYIESNGNVSSNVGDNIEGELDYCAESTCISLGAIRQTFDEENHAIGQRPSWRIWSSGGLLAFMITREKCCCVRNPITGEQIKVPMDPFFREDHPNNTCRNWAFGYSPTSKVYKIFVFLSKLKVASEVHIYTLGSGWSWRILPCEFPFINCSHGYAECDGNLFYIYKMRTSTGRPNFYLFNIELETSRLLKSPKTDLEAEDIYTPFLLTYGDTVAYVENYEDIRCVSMWVLRDKLNEVWVKELNIHTPPLRITPYYTNFRKWINGGTLFGDYGYDSLIIYDAKHKQLKHFSLPYSRNSNGCVRKPDCIYHHVASLVSPKQIMGVAVPKV